MSHKGIRKLLENTAKSLGDDIQYTYARDSDFNLLRDKRYPFISTSPLISTPTYTVNGVQNYMKAWSVQMAFYEKDEPSSGGEEYVEILDEMDKYVDEFINKLNFYAHQSTITSDEIIISGIRQEPFIKAMGDILTGYILTFTITVNDNFNYCLNNDC